MLDILYWIAWFFKWFLILLFCYAIIHAFITHFVLWYETRLDYIQNHPNGKMPPFWFYVKSFFVETIWSFTRYLLTPFYALLTPQKMAKLYQNTFLAKLHANSLNRLHDLNKFHGHNRLNHSNAEKHTLPAVLLVHGYAQNQTDWIWFWHQLQKKTDVPIYTINLSPRFASIADLAKVVANQVDIMLEAMENSEKYTSSTNASQWGGGISQKIHHPQIILVGHSMGGLVCSYYTEHFAKPDTIAKVILIASPIHGTKTVPLGIGKNVIEMRPNSPFLADLREKMIRSDIPYYFVASQLDNMIIPWHSGLLHPVDYDHHKDRNYIIDDTGHSGLLLSPRVVNKIAEWVEEN